MKQAQIAAIIVSYRPEVKALRELVSAISPQVRDVFIVDNGSGKDVVETIRAWGAVNVVALECNFGIAHAQNLGIKAAAKSGCTHVLLLDQDSLPADDMVSQLLLALWERQGAGEKVACVGPYHQGDGPTVSSPFVGVEGLRIVRRPCDGVKTVRSDFLIASGSLIPLEVVKTVGLMIEELFIDYVDIEWGLRAASKGYVCYGICSALMSHKIGDSTIRFGDRRVPLHSPLRQYYHIRNALWLARRSWISRTWKIILYWRVVKQIIFFGVLAAPRIERTKFMFRGVWHGVTDRMGPFH